MIYTFNRLLDTLVIPDIRLAPEPDDEPDTEPEPDEEDEDAEGSYQN